MLPNLVKDVIKAMMPGGSYRVLVPPGAVSVLEDDKLVIYLGDKKIEHPVPPGAKVYRRILEMGYVEYIVEP